MVVDSLLVPECLYRPGTFTGLMTLYESNYIKLNQLGSALEWPADAIVSTSPRDSDLHAAIVRREAYTTTLRLTYWFHDADGLPAPDPDIIVRVYHDARLVEAVSSREAHRHTKLRELARSGNEELDRRWRLNMLLNKWLDYLFEVGHNLGAAERAVS
jgi:uncharacterized protein YqiB (DUF1249 family)